MKTAGTILARHLQQQFRAEQFYPSRGYDWQADTDLEPYISVPRLLAVPKERREQIRMYAGHFPYFAAELLEPGLRTITLLREPVDRTVSVLKHFKRLDADFRDAPLESIYENQGISRRHILDYQTKIFSMVAADNADVVQKPVPIDDERLQRAQQNLARVEFVGLTEQFGAFIEDLRARLGWWPEGIDPSDRANKSPEAWTVSPELRARIAADNPYDMAFYRYAQELVARRREGSDQAESAG